MSEAFAGPELATRFETVLKLSAEGFNRAAAHGRSFIFPCLVMNVLLVADDVIHLACHRFLGLSAALCGGFQQRFERVNHPLFLAVAELMQYRLDPGTRRCGAVAVQFVSQGQLCSARF